MNSLCIYQAHLHTFSTSHPEVVPFCNTMYSLVDLVFQFPLTQTRAAKVPKDIRRAGQVPMRQIYPYIGEDSIQGAPKNLTTRIEATFSSYSMANDTNLVRVFAVRSASTAGVRGANLVHASLASFSRISRSACRMRISTADSKSRPGTGTDES